MTGKTECDFCGHVLFGSPEECPGCRYPFPCEPEIEISTARTGLRAGPRGNQNSSKQRTLIRRLLGMLLDH